MSFRWKIDNTPAQIDEAATQADPDEATLGVLEEIRMRTRDAVDAGVHLSLAEFTGLSNFERLCLQEAQERRRAIDRRHLAEIVGHPNPLAFLPDTDAEFVREKEFAAHAAAMKRLWHGDSSTDANST